MVVRKVYVWDGKEGIGGVEVGGGWSYVVVWYVSFDILLFAPSSSFSLSV